MGRSVTRPLRGVCLQERHGSLTHGLLDGLEDGRDGMDRAFGAG